MSERDVQHVIDAASRWLGAPMATRYMPLVWLSSNMAMFRQEGIDACHVTQDGRVIFTPFCRRCYGHRLVRVRHRRIGTLNTAPRCRHAYHQRVSYYHASRHTSLLLSSPFGRLSPGFAYHVAGHCRLWLFVGLPAWKRPPRLAGVARIFPPATLTERLRTSRTRRLLSWKHDHVCRMLIAPPVFHSTPSPSITRRLLPPRLRVYVADAVCFVATPPYLIMLTIDATPSSFNCTRLPAVAATSHQCQATGLVVRLASPPRYFSQPWMSPRSVSHHVQKEITGHWCLPSQVGLPPAHHDVHQLVGLDAAQKSLYVLFTVPVTVATTSESQLLVINGESPPPVKSNATSG